MPGPAPEGRWVGREGEARALAGRQREEEARPFPERGVGAESFPRGARQVGREVDITECEVPAEAERAFDIGGLRVVAAREVERLPGERRAEIGVRARVAFRFRRRAHFERGLRLPDPT